MLFKLDHALYALADRGEVGHQAAQPALVDVELAAALCLFADRVLRLALRADEKNRTAVLGHGTNEIIRLLKAFDGLLQVDDVTPLRSVKM